MTDARRIAGAALGAVLAAGLVSASGATAATPTRIVGVVTLEGVSQSGVRVRLLEGEDSKRVIKTTTTSGDGSYSFSGGIDTGPSIDHLVYYDDPDLDLVGGARVVGPRAGATVRRTITARPAARVTGRITYPDGTPAGSARVVVRGPDVGEAVRGEPTTPEPVYPTSVTPAADGRYTVGGLPPGEYQIGFIDTSSRWFSVCTDDSDPGRDDDLCFRAAPLTVTRAGSTSAPTRAFERRAASIGGTISGDPGDRTRATRIEVRRRNTSPIVSSVRLLSSGRYRSGTLPAGTWDVRVSTSDPNLEKRWFRATAKRQAAEAVTTVDGQAVNGIDVLLRSKSTTRVSATGGTGRATFTVTVERRTGGAAATGRVDVTVGGLTRSVTLSRGSGTVTLTGLPRGRRTYTAGYVGGRNIAPSERTGSVTVR